MKIKATFLSIIILFSFPAYAAENCRKALRQEIAGPLTVIQGMADYKAAMDAGYAACMVGYPQEFAPLRTVNDFMQTNMQEEMNQALTVLDHMIDEHGGACKAEAREEVHAQIDGQYKKAYARRHRIMSKAGLVTEDQDSCLIVLDMVKKYNEHYGSFDQLQYVLYESSKKQGNASKRAFKKFENIRDQIAVSKP